MNKLCQCCKGEGARWIGIRKLNNSSQVEQHYVPCDAAGCENGIFNREKYYASWGIEAKEP